jgi:hypothetical protein
MSTTVINTNIMNVISKWLEDNEYIQDKKDIDDEAWDHLDGAIASELKKGKGDKVKDPAAPKRGKSAYIFFCAAKRSDAKDKLGEDASLPEISKMLGSLWSKFKVSTKQADKKELAGFEAEAANDKLRYDNEMSSYVRPSDDELSKKGKKAKKDPNAPKRGKSGYIFFCSANRSDVKEELGEDAKTTEITSRLGELWTELKNDESRAEELASYLKMATDDKDRYVSEKADYTSNDSSEESDSKVVKKPVAKKPVAKKPDAKKPEAKKPATKKTVTKKPATKKPDEEEDLEEDDEDEDE